MLHRPLAHYSTHLILTTTAFPTPTAVTMQLAISLPTVREVRLRLKYRWLYNHVQELPMPEIVSKSLDSPPLHTCFPAFKLVIHDLRKLRGLVT